LSDLAHKWDLPLNTVLESGHLFKQYAVLPGFEEDEDVFRDGLVDEAAMMALVCTLCDIVTIEDLPVTPQDIMGIVDKNSDGTVDFCEFSHWYHERAFLEYMNLTKTEIETRRAGCRLGISLADMDHYKGLFNKFDADSSGMICKKEFKDLMHVLMKVPKDLDIPETRITHFWQEADSDGSGLIDLEEFISFYIKHFNTGSDNPMEDYYKAFRRCSA